MKIADRISRIQPSITLEMTAKAAELRQSGIDVINLSVGEPDFDTPENIKEAVSLNPWCIDVNSGVESSLALKDTTMMDQIIKNFKNG